MCSEWLACGADPSAIRRSRSQRPCQVASCLGQFASSLHTVFFARSPRVETNHSPSCSSRLRLRTWYACGVLKRVLEGLNASAARRDAVRTSGIVPVPVTALQSAVCSRPCSKPGAPMVLHKLERQCVVHRWKGACKAQRCRCCRSWLACTLPVAFCC